MSIGLMWATLIGGQIVVAILFFYGRGWFVDLLGEDQIRAASLLTYGAIGVLLLISLAVLVVTNGTVRERRERLARSVATEAEVASVDVSGIKGDSGYKEDASLRFLSRDGYPREAQLVLPKNDLKVGQRLTVRYDAQDPTWVVLDNWDPIGVRYMGLVALGMLVFTLIPIVWAAVLLLG